MGTLVVAPADVQSHGAGIDAFEGVIDGRHDGPSPTKELLERPIGEEGVALEGEIGGVDLEEQAVIDDGPVLGGKSARDGVYELLVRGVMAVVHSGSHDARGGRRP